MKKLIFTIFTITFLLYVYSYTKEDLGKTKSINLIKNIGEKLWWEGYKSNNQDMMQKGVNTLRKEINNANEKNLKMYYNLRYGVIKEAIRSTGIGLYDDKRMTKVISLALEILKDTYYTQNIKSKLFLQKSMLFSFYKKVNGTATKTDEKIIKIVKNGYGQYNGKNDIREDLALYLSLGGKGEDYYSNTEIKEAFFLALGDETIPNYKNLDQSKAATIIEKSIKRLQKLVKKEISSKNYYEDSYTTLVKLVQIGALSTLKANINEKSIK